MHVIIKRSKHHETIRKKTHRKNVEHNKLSVSVEHRFDDPT